MSSLGRITSWVLVTVILGFACGAHASNSGVTFQGRILKPDGAPLSGHSTQFKMQVRTPDLASCLMYEEIQTLDLSATNGSFSLTINDGAGTRTDATGLALERIFANFGTFTLDPTKCSSGAGSFTPSATDGRDLVVLFKDETMATWEPIPAQKIAAVPYAMDAIQVAGFSADSLLRVVNGSGSPLTGLAPLSNAQYTELIALVNGTSTAFTKANQLGGVALPTMSTGEVLGWNGSAWVSQTAVGGANSVTTAMIQANAIDSGKIATGAVGTTQIASNVTINTSGTVGSAITTTRDFKIYATSPSSFYVGMLAPALAASYTLTWPMDDGNNGEVLTTNGSGVLTWAPPATSSQWTTHGSNISYDGGGNVGIGTSSPQAPLSVAGPNYGGTRFNVLFDDTTAMAADVGGGIALRGKYKADGSIATFGAIHAGKDDGSEAGLNSYLSLYSRSGSVTERMRITSNGNVGIGTTSPASPLDVVGDVNASGSYKLGSSTVVAVPAAGTTVIGVTGASTNATASANNTVVGANAANALTTGTSNVAVGQASLSTTTTGVQNVGVGRNALSANTTGSYNTAVGYLTLGNAQASGNTAVGFAALSGLGNTGTNNEAIGATALASVTSGQKNEALGSNALMNVTTGSSNIGIGYAAFGAMTTGSNNIGIGSGVLGISSGSNNIVLGPLSGSNLTTGSNNIIIGYNLAAPSAGVSNTMTIGNLIYATGLTSTGTTVSSGKVGIGTTSPSAILTLKAGTATAGTAPLKFTSGTLLTTPEDGAMEYNSGSGLWFTIGSTRYVIPTNTAAGNYSNVSTISNAAGSITMTPMAGNSVIINQSTTSTNSTSGALIVNGGVGIAGALNTGGNIVSGGSITATTNAVIPQIYGSTAPSGDIRIDGTSDAAKGNVYLASAGGNVGIGTTSPTSPLTVTNVTTATSGNKQALEMTQTLGTSATVVTTTARGAYFVGQYTGSANSPGATTRGAEGVGYNAFTGTIGSVSGVLGHAQNTNTGTILTASGARFDVTNTGGGTINNAYGVHIGNVEGVNKWSMFASDATAPSYFAGNVGIGTSSPTNFLHLVTTGAVVNKIQQDSQVGGSGLNQTSQGATPYVAQQRSNAGATAVVVNDYLGSWNTSGHDGTAYRTSTTIRGEADVNPANGSSPGRITFATAPVGTSTVPVERMRIGSNGNVGIGTTVPNYLFEVSTAGSGIYTPNAGIPQSSATIGITSTYAGASNSTTLLFNAGGSANAYAYVSAVRPASNWADLVFGMRTGPTSYVEALRLSSSGNVGIGTTSPSVLLDVVGNSAQNGIRLGRSANTQQMAYVLAPQGTTSASNVTWFSGIEASSNDYRVWNWNGSTSNYNLVVTNAGKVGIGTTSPNAVLDVGGTLNASGIISSGAVGTPGSIGLRDTFGATQGWLSAYPGELQLAQNINGGYLTFLTNNGSSGERMRITAAGNVGIGTTAPQSTLQVNGYTQLALTSGAPPSVDCDAANEYGRMKVDSSAGLLYICMASGWVAK